MHFERKTEGGHAVQLSNWDGSKRGVFSFEEDVLEAFVGLITRSLNRSNLSVLTDGCHFVAVYRPCSFQPIVKPQRKSKAFRGVVY